MSAPLNVGGALIMGNLEPGSPVLFGFIPARFYSSLVLFQPVWFSSSPVLFQPGFILYATRDPTSPFCPRGSAFEG